MFLDVYAPVRRAWMTDLVAYGDVANWRRDGHQAALAASRGGRRVCTTITTRHTEHVLHRGHQCGEMADHRGHHVCNRCPLVWLTSLLELALRTGEAPDPSLVDSPSTQGP